MTLERRNDVRNLAIIAHVDHGKSTLVDSMLWQSRILAEHDWRPDRVLDAFDPDRAKGIAIMFRHTSLLYRNVRINILDIPGHANFGGEVERTLRMAEGLLLLVDAVEGPAPQTRFVLRKALEEGLPPIVVINKIDRPLARPREVLEEVREMIIDLDAGETQREFPVLFANALRGTCRSDPDGPDTSLAPLFEEILRRVPPPAFDPAAPLGMLVTHLGYDDFLGRLAVGRIVHGSLRPGQEVAHCRLDGTVAAARIGGVFGYEGVRRVPIDEAGPGDIVAVDGVGSVSIGETLADPKDPRPLPAVRVDEPTIAIEVAVNDSPLAGLDGHHVDRESLRERLWQEILTNVSIHVEETDSPDVFRIAGRSELQLAILTEMLRREGFEMLVGKPRAMTRVVDGAVHEPMEVLVIDCPEDHVPVVTRRVETRRGRMTRMVNHGRGRVRLEFRIPSRGLLGFRGEFLADTRRTGIMNHVFESTAPWQGDIPQRSTGALIADRPGRATANAIEHLQARGTMFVGPGDEVYDGMIVGENAGPNDVPVNVVKDRRPGTDAPVERARTVGLVPPRSMSLEQALEWVRDDEVVEVTPRALRLRKKILPGSPRPHKS